RGSQLGRLDWPRSTASLRRSDSSNRARCGFDAVPPRGRAGALPFAARCSVVQRAFLGAPVFFLLTGMTVLPLLGIQSAGRACSTPREPEQTMVGAVFLKDSSRLD